MVVRKIICVSPVFTTLCNTLSWSTCDQADQVLNQHTVCLQQCSLHPLPPNPKGCCFTPSNPDRAADQRDPCHFLNTPSVGLDRLGVIKPIYFTVAATGLLCNYVLFAQGCPCAPGLVLCPDLLDRHYHSDFVSKPIIPYKAVFIVVYAFSFCTHIPLKYFTIEASKYLRV